MGSTLKPISVDGATIFLLSAPRNWNAHEHGDCIGLPVVVDGGYHYSWWKLDWRQRLQVLFGYPIRLTFVDFQPAVAVEIVPKAGE